MNPEEESRFVSSFGPMMTSWRSTGFPRFRAKLARVVLSFSFEGAFGVLSLGSRSGLMLEIVHFENWLPCFLMWMFNPGNVSIKLRKVDIAIGGPWLCVGWSWMIYLSMYLILSYLILSYLILSDLIWSYLILSDLIWSYPILSYPILSICLSIYPSIHLSI